MKASVLLNVAAGSVESKETSEALARIRAAFQAAGAEASVQAVEPAGLPAAVDRAAAGDHDAVVLGGGDGTLSTGVAALARDGQPKPLGILPLGTFNHFAKDLGIPIDLDGAVRTVVAGGERSVDLGEVNGNVFLNNSSIGIYPEVVRQREEIQDGGIAPRWAAMLRAAVDQLQRFPMVTVTLRLPAREMRVTSPMIFVGNNRYEMNLLKISRRARLDAGELFLYVARDRSRIGFVALALRALFARLDPEKDFVSAGLPCLEVATSWRWSLRVALDGEVRRLATPLRYRVRPRALRVLAPPVPA
ncbi:MAG: sphingosine kinase [Acidobacteria bacterium]|nr:MAG: sphingosine kinase [Acidobacteriota bacterium]